MLFADSFGAIKHCLTLYSNSMQEYYWDLLMDIAEALGVSRQMVSMWENGKKSIPRAREEQLAKLFGVDPKLVGEIIDEQKRLLESTPMIKNELFKKEVYRYNLDEKVAASNEEYYFAEKEESLTEIYKRVCLEKKECIDGIESRFDMDTDILMDKIVRISNKTNLYRKLLSIDSNGDDLNLFLRSPYYLEINSLLDAFLLAIDAREEKDIRRELQGYANYVEGEYWEHIQHLSSMIREHLDEQNDNVFNIAKKMASISKETNDFEFTAREKNKDIMKIRIDRNKTI